MTSVIEKFVCIGSTVAGRGEGLKMYTFEWIRIQKLIKNREGGVGGTVISW